ncbi:RNA ligase/cyclic nucleotide phosphodiesterase [Aspergillus egyptiacus]|nr:RNA ligase/cyclic nucleotide phosphodiesterase [Aspergillus egyptiacus]
MTLITDAPQAPTNPFDQLLHDCHNNSKAIQSRYEAHRTNRNIQSREKLLHPGFPGWDTDEILAKLIAHQSTETDENSNSNSNNARPRPPFVDHRHNLNFCARPPSHIKELVAEIQRELLDVVPGLWLAPPEYLHITTIELANSRTKEEIDVLATQLKASGVAPKLLEYASAARNHTRLVKPILSYDASAMALSFLPAAGEPTAWTSGLDYRHRHDDAYTYHHLRRDLAGMVMDAGLAMHARYIVPSAHVTVARFVSREGILDDGGVVDRGKVGELVERVERVNAMLREKYWPDSDQGMPAKGEWVVGKEGFEFNKGTTWYGGGEKMVIGTDY